MDFVLQSIQCSVCVCVRACVLEFNVPPTTKIIRRQDTAESLIRQTGDAADRSKDTWFTKPVVYPLHHNSSRGGKGDWDFNQVT